MTTTELIKALRSKESRDNRALLDAAADRLEAMRADMDKLRVSYEPCEVCAHYAEADKCKECDYDCEMCISQVCHCKDCRNENLWLWRGDRNE